MPLILVVAETITSARGAIPPVHIAEIDNGVEIK
jgi:hypothetical protein